jgi:uncharacterized Zn-finger protein
MEIIDSFSTSVSCQGKNPLHDHPKVYLEIDPKIGFINCPYCSKEFRLVKQ